MKTLKIFILLLLSSNLLAQTTIYNKQEVFGTWSPKGSPYIIKGEAIVPAGKILKIKAGTEIRFATGTDRDYDANETPDVGFLRVNGNIEAVGKKKKLILFTREGNYGNWGVVYINSCNSENLLKYCKLEYAYYVRNIISNDNATAALSFNNSGGLVQNCLIVNNGWNAVNCKNSASPIIMNNTIYKNNYAIECNSESSPKIINTIIYGNKKLFYLNGKSYPKISYSLVQAYKLPKYVVDEGNNMFNVKPLFVNSYDGNFKLKSNSHCIKKGKGGKNIGAF